MVQKTRRLGLFSATLLLPVGLLLLIGVRTADARQCSVAPTSTPQGHWSYRTIAGRKCWYVGDNNFPKSLLHWPEQSSALSAFDKAEPRSDEQPMPRGMQIQPVAEECCKALLRDSDSFEDRWRALGMRR